MTAAMFIRGIGAVGAFGCGVTALKTALAGEVPQPVSVEIDTVHGPRLVRGLRADTSPLREMVPGRELRRMEHHIRIALLAAYEALGDAERRGCRRPARLGIVMATGYGATCNSFDFQHLAPGTDAFSGSPTQFSNSVHNAAAAYLSIALRENGPNHSVSHYDLSVPMALSVAGQWLDEGRVEAVLLGAVDEFSKAQACVWQDRAEARPEAASLPAIGEGACFLLLTAGSGDEGGYGLVQGLEVGRQQGTESPTALPWADHYLIGADGFGSRDGDYPAVLSAAASRASYAHLYGVLPVAMAFDLAVAALCLEAGRIFPGVSLPGLDAVLPGGRTLANGARLCCLKLGVAQGYGWAALGWAGGDTSSAA